MFKVIILQTPILNYYFRFEYQDMSLILNKGDAEFVDVIHTNSGTLWEVILNGIKS